MVQTRGVNKRKPSNKREISMDDALTLRKSITSPKNKTPNRVSKRTPSNTSNITPTKSTPTKTKKPELKLNTITEQEILTALKSDDLVNMINQLTSTTQDELFNNYKLKAKEQMEQDEVIIKQLNEELEEKKKQIEELLENDQYFSSKIRPDKSEEEVVDTSKRDNLYISPIRKKRNVDEEVINEDGVTKELETIGIILDMLQLLTGLKIINYEEDSNQFYFDVEQNSTNDKVDKIVLEYRLIISKKFSSIAEINYIPSFLNNHTEKDKLLKILPEYFCDKLTFPYNTLSQFYTKMNKALNKGFK